MTNSLRLGYESSDMTHRLTYYSPWWTAIEGSCTRLSTFTNEDCLLSSPRSSGFIFSRFQIRSSTFALDRLVWLKDRPFWRKIVCFCLDRMLWPMDRLLSTRIVCFDPFYDRLLLHSRIVCFRPYFLDFVSMNHTVWRSRKSPIRVEVVLCSFIL